MMINRKVFLPVLSFFLITLFSCAQTQIIKLNTNFNPSEVKWFYQKGNNTIKGQSFARTNGGNIVTCAGLPVYLEPVSKYAEERIAHIYGNTQKGVFTKIDSASHPGLFLKTIIFKPDNPKYYKYMKQTICDANGNFKFTNLPNGEYFVTSMIMWDTSTAVRYYVSFMQRVEVNNGEKKKILLTNY